MQVRFSLGELDVSITKPDRIRLNTFSTHSNYPFISHVDKNQCCSGCKSKFGITLKRNLEFIVSGLFLFLGLLGSLHLGVLGTTLSTLAGFLDVVRDNDFILWNAFPSTLGKVDVGI